MRMPNDVSLAEEVPEFHLILGGHDHHYERREVGISTHWYSSSVSSRLTSRTES